MPSATSITGKGRAGFIAVLVQILVLDIVFSVDSVITAVGVANDLAIMVVAMVLAILVMLGAASPLSGFVERHPSVKILALSEDQEEAAAQEDQVPPGRRPGTTHDQLSPQTYPEWT